MNRRSLLGLIFGAPVAASIPAALAADKLAQCRALNMRRINNSADPLFQPGDVYYQGAIIRGVPTEAMRQRWKALHILHTHGVIRG